MASFLTAFCIVVFNVLGATLCFEWETLPEPVVYSCVGSKVMFPWRYRADDVDLIRDIRWFFDGDFDSVMVGTQTYGYFFPTPPYSQRVRQLTNGGLVLSDVTMADTGNYTVEVNLEGEGAAVTHRRSALLQVADGLMTEGGIMTASQDPIALWDSSTHQWIVRLTCGRFTFRGQPPVHVIWTTPTMETKASSGYDNGHFYLTLASPVMGGNYTCHIPHHLLSHVCVTDSNHGNHTLRGRVLVDGVKVRLSLLEAERKTLQQDKTVLKRQIQTQDEAIRNLTSQHTELRADLQKTRAVLEEALGNLTHHMTDPCGSSHQTLLNDPRRAVTNGRGILCDKILSPGWYRFVLDGRNAVIPTHCAPRNHCGTHYPYWLDLQGEELPAAGQQTEARACGRYSSRCCYWHTPITVHNCGAFFVYKLEPTRGCFKAYCAQKVDS